jgi:outer membrane protein OmpA-like peptidoglycan-associated protein
VRSALLSGLLGVVTFAAAIAAPLSSTEVQELHQNRIEALKRLGGVQDQFQYAIHTLIVPVGAVKNYNFPIPVARIRYEALPLFAFDDARVRPDGVEIIEQLARQFKDDQTLRRVAVVGHTDSVGADEYNYELSLRRALSVANILRLNGVSSDLITVHGLGESYPIATNETPEGRAQNRRVEFFLSSIPEAIPPSIQGSGFNPKFRNNHDPGCRKDDATAPCGATSMNTFPTHKLTTDGKLAPTDEVITIVPNPKYPVTEIPERVHVPTDVKTRPPI